MPTFREARTEAVARLVKNGEVTRSLAISAIAIVWVFKDGVPLDPPRFHPLLVNAALWAVMTLAIDFFHSIISSAGLYVVVLMADNCKTLKKEEDEILLPLLLTYCGIALWLLRASFLTVSYVYVLQYLWRMWK